MEIKNKFRFMMMLCAALCMPFFASCSDDDDDDSKGGGSASTGSVVGVPASVVDGVLTSSASTTGSGAISTTYNSDGTIDKVVMDGTTYKFEYAETSAAKAPMKANSAFTNGRTLVRISDAEDASRFTAKDIKFDPQTYFVTSFVETTKESWGDEYEITTVKYTFSYNSDGTLKSAAINGTWKDSDGESGSAKTTQSYTYSNGNLTKIEAKNGAYGESTSFEYGDKSLENKYNKIVPMQAAGFGIESAISYILAMQGYMGNASQLLPTKAVYREWGPAEDGEPAYDYSDVYTMSYTFDDIKRITSISSTNNNMWVVEWLFAYLMLN